MTQDLDFAVALARQAGAVMTQYFQVGVHSESKADGTPVTLADTTINALVIDAVAVTYPADGVLGEEQSKPGTDPARLWVCDPIDGTRPFSFGIPTNMFSLALIEDGLPRVAVLFDPYLDRMYTATAGAGTELNGHSVAVSSAELHAGVVALPGAQFGLTDTGALLHDALSQGLRFLTVGSITYESALVATGQLVGCVFPGMSPWDIAAVKLIVEEAGGRVTDIYGREQRYDAAIAGAIISNGIAHEQLLALVAEHLV